jgi:hypothetical protein
MENSVRVIEVFTIGERRVLLAVLESFDWNFSLGLGVQLQGSGTVLRARQAGSGNHEGRAVVELSPSTTWEQALEMVRNLQKGPINLVIRKGP